MTLDDHIYNSEYIIDSPERPRPHSASPETGTAAKNRNKGNNDVYYAAKYAQLMRKLRKPDQDKQKA